MKVLKNVVDKTKIRRERGKVSTCYKKIVQGEEGMGVVEVILIIVVLIGIATLFKTEITSVVKNVLMSIKNQVGTF